MDIRTALARIKTVEEALAISAPETLSIKKVYTTTPKQDAMLEAPCFIHGWDLQSVRHVAGLRQRRYVVRSQFLTDNPDLDRAADIAAAFEQQWVDAFSNDLTLAGACTGPIEIRGGSPTLAGLVWNERKYVGLELVIEIPMTDAPTVGP